MNTSNQDYLSVAVEFSTTPGPRTPDEGDFCGEIFLADVLSPRFQDARKNNKELLVDLDGTEGYATSFLEAAFGGLAREHGIKEVLQRVKIKTLDEPFLEDEILEYIHKANDPK